MCAKVNCLLSLVLFDSEFVTFFYFCEIIRILISCVLFRFLNLLGSSLGLMARVCEFSWFGMYQFRDKQWHPWDFRWISSLVNSYRFLFFIVCAKVIVFWAWCLWLFRLAKIGEIYLLSLHKSLFLAWISLLFLVYLWSWNINSVSFFLILLGWFPCRLWTREWGVCFGPRANGSSCIKAQDCVPFPSF